MQSQPWIVMVIICTSLLLIFLPAVESNPSIGDIVLGLPRQPVVSFQQYARYVIVNTDSSQPQRALFYYFVEAETQPASKPVVLWLNGGPGCSSLGLGAFFTHGPFKPSGSGTLIKNDYSWNKGANMLYVESQAGVGFSYSENKTFYTNVTDDMAAQDNFIFLQHWLLKFPQYKNSSIYLAGESYVGHYVPQLLQLIIQSKINITVKGMIMGSPLFDFANDFDGQDEFYWSRGLISDASYKFLTTVCSTSKLLSQAFRGNLSEDCDRVNTQVSKELTLSIDPNNVLGDICVPTNQSQLEKLNPKMSSRFQLQASLPQQTVTANTDPCLQRKIGAYLNRTDVQMALHAKLVGITQWTRCSRVLNYNLVDLEVTTTQLLGSFVKSGIRTLVYSGDVDGSIPFTGTRTLIDGLAKDLGLTVTVPYRPWFEGKQVGGWPQVYGDIF